MKLTNEQINDLLAKHFNCSEPCPDFCNYRALAFNYIESELVSLEAPEGDSTLWSATCAGSEVHGDSCPTRAVWLCLLNKWGLLDD